MIVALEIDVRHQYWNTNSKSSVNYVTSGDLDDDDKFRHKSNIYSAL